MPAVRKRKQKLEKRLPQLYYNARSTASYGGVDRLQSISKTNKKKTKKWLSSQLTYTLHKPAKRRFPRRKYVTRGLDFQHQADLVEMQDFARDNAGHRYMLTLIDIFSRYAWAVPMKNKTAKETVRALKKIYSSESTRTPKVLQTDAGKEFENRDVRKYLSSIGAEQFSIASPMKAAIVERFNRTLKNRMWRVFTKRGSHRWIEVLPDLLHSYNNTPHRSLKMRKPSEITKVNESDVWLELYSGDQRHRRRRKPKFSINDRVRISKAKTIFEKGYLPNWTEEEFFVNAIDKKFKPVMYELRDHNGEIIRGKFYEQEMQHVINKNNTFRIDKVIRTRGQGAQKEALVKWKGYKDTEWIPFKSIKPI